MIFQKYIPIIMIFALAGFISGINAIMDKRKKNIFERCNRKIIGSECGDGMECSKKFHICLRTKNQFCLNNKECLSGKCRHKRCKD